VGGQGSIVEAAGEDLIGQIKDSAGRVWLASPFITAAEAKRIAGAVAGQSGQQLRLITALTPRPVQTGVLDPKALMALSAAGFTIRSIPNLHAKLSLIDRWGSSGRGT
jgi:hypothetical protein